MDQRRSFTSRAPLPSSARGAATMAKSCPSAGLNSWLLNETVAFVVSRERMESLIETLELLANPAFVRAWRAEKAGKGKSYPARTGPTTVSARRPSG